MTDLSQVPDQELRGEAARVLALLLMKHIRDGDLDAHLPKWADLFRRVAEMRTPGVHLLRLVVEYLLQASESLEPEALLTFLARDVGPEAEEIAMTMAERLRAEGRAEGRAEVVLRQLGVRFRTLSSDDEARVRAASEAELDLWAERLLTPASLAEVFAPLA